MGVSQQLGLGFCPNLPTGSQNTVQGITKQATQLIKYSVLG